MYPERKNAAFSEENIERTIAGSLAEIEAGTRPAFLPRPKPQPYRPHPKYKGFLALYYHYCYLLGRIEKRQYPPRMTPHLRREIMKAETYKARLKFLQENGISTADDLTTCMQRAENAVTQLAKQRTILNVRKKKRKKLFDALAAEESLAVSKPSTKKGYPAWNLSTRSTRKRKPSWIPAAFHGRLSRRKKRISTSSLRSSTSRSAPSDKRSSCAVRLRIPQQRCSRTLLPKKNPYMKKKQRIYSQTGGDSPST